MPNLQPSFIKRPMQNSEAMDELDQLLVYTELLALHELDETQRNQILNMQQQTFENQQEQEDVKKSQMGTLGKTAVKPKPTSTTPLNDQGVQNEQLATYSVSNKIERTNEHCHEVYSRE